MIGEVLGRYKINRAKILDFGLARWECESLLDQETVTSDGSPATQPGALLGTIHYMSPEQVAGRPADARSDIFSFGSVLYEMLTGKRAFHAETPAETMVAILKEDPEPIESFSPSAPGGELRSIVAHCLEKAPEDRFQSARDLAFALTLAGCGSWEDSASSLQTDDPAVTRARAPAGGEVASRPADPSIAVLPFAALTPDPETEQFRDGLAEELISALAKLAALRVVVADPDLGARSEDSTPSKIREALDVKTIVQGSVRRAGGRIRVSAKLVNLAGAYHLWSETYDGDPGDVFATQKSIADLIN